MPRVRLSKSSDKEAVLKRIITKPQIGFERRTLSVRRFSVTAGSVWCRGIVLDAGDVLY